MTHNRLPLSLHSSRKAAYLFTGVYFVSQYLESLATRHVRTTTHTSPRAHARSSAAASPHPDAVLTRLAAQRSNVLGLHSALTTADGHTARRSKLVGGAWWCSLLAGSDARPPAPSAYYLSLTAAASQLSSTASILKTFVTTRCALCRDCVFKACQPGAHRAI